MLCIMHESDQRGVLLLNGKPIPDEALARMLNLDNQTLNQTLNLILNYGVASRRESDGAIYCRRMVRDQKLIEIRREAGKMGGNPVLLKQKPTTHLKQNPTPSSSVSSSVSSSEKKTICVDDPGKQECRGEPKPTEPKKKRQRKPVPPLLAGVAEIIAYLNEKSGRIYNQNAENVKVINARLMEPDVTVEGVKIMIDRMCKKWMGTSMEDYLRPSTLFRASKFEGYYASRLAPISTEEHHGRKQNGNTGANIDPRPDHVRARDNLVAGLDGPNGTRAQWRRRHRLEWFMQFRCPSGTSQVNEAMGRVWHDEWLKIQREQPDKRDQEFIDFWNESYPGTDPYD